MYKMTVEIDPNDAFVGIKQQKLLEATGILPYFAEDVSMSQPESTQEAFDMLMECYGMGMGQDGSGWGTVSPEGTYKSEHKEDPDMDPLVVFHLTEDIEFLVFQYAICAVRGTDGDTLMMRMD